jgi:hypothetical protein
MIIWDKVSQGGNKNDRRSLGVTLRRMLGNKDIRFLWNVGM